MKKLFPNSSCSAVWGLFFFAHFYLKIKDLITYKILQMVSPPVVPNAITHALHFSNCLDIWQKDKNLSTNS